MPTYKLLIEYNGSAYNGWQIQANAATIQGAMEDALEVLLRTRTTITASGRTDTGVHARGQVAHFSTEQPIDPHRTRRSLNGLLPPDIAVLRIEEAPSSFHARFDARSRRYHYYVSTEPRALDRHMRWLLRPAPDFDRMNKVARLLVGQQHFGAFCRTQSETENRVCMIAHACWVAEARPGDWRFEIAADRFLHGMVRAIVGTLVQIGHARRPADDLPRILASRDRRAAGPAAPAHGLVLEEVRYESDRAEFKT